MRGCFAYVYVCATHVCVPADSKSVESHNRELETVVRCSMGSGVLIWIL